MTDKNKGMTKFIEAIKANSAGVELLNINLAVQDNIDREKRFFKPKEAIEKCYDNEDYRKEFHKTGTKRLPKGFDDFVHSDLSADFVDSIHEYCEFLIKIENKKLELDKDAKERKIPPP